MVLEECRPKYFNILIYFNIKMVLEECRPKYFDIQMAREKGVHCIWWQDRHHHIVPFIPSYGGGGGGELLGLCVADAFFTIKYI